MRKIEMDSLVLQSGNDVAETKYLGKRRTVALNGVCPLLLAFLSSSWLFVFARKMFTFPAWFLASCFCAIRGRTKN